MVLIIKRYSPNQKYLYSNHFNLKNKLIDKFIVIKRFCTFKELN